MSEQILLDFGYFSLEASLFDTSIAKSFTANLPYKIELKQWGNEVYGSIGLDLGEDDPIPEIPCGGIAYTNNGNYLCVFFGQTPAWPVEYIGNIKDDSWKILLEQNKITTVSIIKK